MPKLRPAGLIRAAKVSNPACERIFGQLFEVLKFGNLAKCQLLLEYLEFRGGVRPAKNIKFVNPAREKLKIRQSGPRAKTFGHPCLPPVILQEKRSIKFKGAP